MLPKWTSMSAPDIRKAQSNEQDRIVSARNHRYRRRSLGLRLSDAIGRTPGGATPEDRHRCGPYGPVDKRAAAAEGTSGADRRLLEGTGRAEKQGQCTFIVATHRAGGIDLVEKSILRYLRGTRNRLVPDI